MPRITPVFAVRGPACVYQELLCTFGRNPVYQGPKEAEHELCLSLMSQYTPLYGTDKLSKKQNARLAMYPDLHHRVTKREYDKLIRHCTEGNITNVLIQEGDVAEESFIPKFG